jgi:transcriptional regulator with XRE-family HTH domain
MEERSECVAPETTDVEQNLALRVVRLRKERGWKQVTLARQTGLRCARLSYLERGIQRFRVSELLAVAAAFGLSVDELILGGRPSGREISGLLRRLEAVVPPEEAGNLARVLEALLAGYAARHSATTTLHVAAERGRAHGDR